LSSSAGHLAFWPLFACLDFLVRRSSSSCLRQFTDHFLVDTEVTAGSSVTILFSISNCFQFESSSVIFSQRHFLIEAEVQNLSFYLEFGLGMKKLFI
jgi:hypothetical protein